MKSLFVVNMGIGNVVQTIPLYLALREKLDLDVVYQHQYKTDSIAKASIFPNHDIDEATSSEIVTVENKYEYVIQPPFMTKFDGKEHNYIQSIQDSFRETDSEVRRNMKILDYFGIDKAIKRDLLMSPSPHKGDIVIHNGAVEGWGRKKYPYFHIVAKYFTDKGYTVTSIGSPQEYIPLTLNATGSSLKKTAATIFNHKVYIGTDTGTYHVAAMLEKPGVVVFTATDPWKNYDEDFHKSFTPAHTNLPCQPCQRGYHFFPEWGECEGFPCQQVDPMQLITMVERKLEKSMAGA